MTDKSDCFALKPNGCSALVIVACPAKCRFYKSREQREADRQKAYEHMNSLPEDQQLMIADTYYKGKRPWIRHILC